MDHCKEAQTKSEGGAVLPPSDSHISNVVGLHWLRISFDKAHLGPVADFCCKTFGSHQSDGFGLWSYSNRLFWKCGVSLNYDEDLERSQSVHVGKMTLDVPGSALDQLTVPDLALFVEYCHAFGGKCSRIDVFFDDYGRIVRPQDLREVIERNDYSGLRTAGRRDQWQGGQLIRDEVFFGQRGGRGNGKYLRCYDKNLESDGEKNCIRWEVEFTQKHAQAVFEKLAATGGDLEAFATICASLIAGVITFVHRNGDKNINRLPQYSWWKQITEILGGKIAIRVTRKPEQLRPKMQWVEKNVSPSLACIKRVFISERAFLRWLFDICKDGDARMNNHTEDIARQFEGCLDYRWGELSATEESNYELSQL